MIYDAAKTIDVERAKHTFLQMLNKKCKFELTEKTLRSKSQNNYLHLIITYLAMNVGVDVEYAKVNYYKREANRELFEKVNIDPVTGKTLMTLRSSASLSKEEMQLSIERFKDWSVNVAGWRLPDANEKDWLAEIEIEANRPENRRFL